MNFVAFHVVSTSGVRRAIVRANDVEEDVAFQNDVNRLLATLHERQVPMRALGWLGTAPDWDPRRPTGQRVPGTRTRPRAPRSGGKNAGDAKAAAAVAAPAGETGARTPPIDFAAVGQALISVSPTPVSEQATVQVDWAPAARRRRLG